MASSLRSLFRGWWAALLLVVVACASPGRATAECGDYVVILNTNDPASPDGRATPFSTPTGSVEHPASPKVPCSGPNCSRSPERHPAPFAPVSPPGPHGKEVVQTLGSVEPTDSASSRICDFISPRPIRRASSVFHPPRAI
jgi:hypothetical protein